MQSSPFLCIREKRPSGRNFRGNLLSSFLSWHRNGREMAASSQLPECAAKVLDRLWPGVRSLPTTQSSAFLYTRKKRPSGRNSRGIWIHEFSPDASAALNWPLVLNCRNGRPKSQTDFGRRFECEYAPPGICLPRRIAGAVVPGTPSRTKMVPI
jgi:hypothetical protein